MTRKSIPDVFDSVRRNVSYAVRTLARTPGFTLTVVVTLAIAIGANSVVFSVIDNVLLRPLPFAGAERLVYVTHVDGASSLDIAIPPVRLLDWSERSSTLEPIAAYYTNDVSDTTSDRPELVRVATVTPDFLELWGIAPAIGRDFIADEHRFGGPSSVLVSDRYWRTRLNADPAILGDTLEIDDRSLTVVGLMPPAFESVDRSVDLWTPHPVDAPWTVSREGGWFAGVVGRLKPGTTLDQAQEDLVLVQSRLAAEHPETDDGLTLRVDPYKDTVVGASSASLWLLFGAVTVLLLIACSNVAALLLARGSRREREVSIRFSLGASRKAVALPLMAETIVLVAAGTVAGLFVASSVMAAMTTSVADLPRADEIAIDGRIFMYTLASAAIVVLACGLLPAAMSSRAVDAAMRRGRNLVAPRHSLNWVLVGAQVALSVTLLAGAGLLLRSFDALARVDPGFDSGQVLTFRLSGSREAVDEAWVQRVNATLAELSAVPGVEAAATSFSFWPGVSDVYREEVEFVEGRVAAEERVVAETLTVSPSYFETMQIPLWSGELCQQPENQGTQAVVNRRFAERYFSGRPAIGLHLIGDTPKRIVGIVSDARETGLHRAVVPTVYLCFSAPTTIPWFLVRTSGEPMSVVESVRAKLNELYPLRSVHDIAPLSRRIADVYAQDRLRTTLLTFFSVTALSLACLGLYGTLSYIVSLRRREIGLRVALGALRSEIVAQFLTKGLQVVSVACLVGLALAFLLTRSLSGMLYGVSPSDPATLVGVIGVVLLVATASALLPALRASRLEPMEALRDD